MLSIQPARPQKCTPNLLPARIHHNGPINDTERHWKPDTDDTGKQHAYFRGRHLHGTAVALPAAYTGAVLHITDKQLSQPPAKSEPTLDNDAEDEPESESVEVSIAQHVAEFDEIVLWGHGEDVHVAQDAFVRGLTEWVGFAESMHLDEADEEAQK